MHYKEATVWQSDIMSRVVVQIGFKRSRREGQKICARIVTANESISWTNYPGRWLTSVAQRATCCWHLCELDLNVGDVISVICHTGLRGLGPDEKRTFAHIYRIGLDTDPVLTVEIPGVGHGKYPVVKGRLIEMSEVTAEDLREKDVEQFLDEENF